MRICIILTCLSAFSLQSISNRIIEPITNNYYIFIYHISYIFNIYIYIYISFMCVSV